MVDLYKQKSSKGTISGSKCHCGSCDVCFQQAILASKEQHQLEQLGLDRYVVFDSQRTGYLKKIKDVEVSCSLMVWLREQVSQGGNDDLRDELRKAEQEYTTAVQNSGKWWCLSEALSRSVKKMASDGNCLFRSIGQFVTGQQDTHLYIRQRIVQYGVSNYHSLFDVDVMASNGYPGPQQYQDTMIKPMVYGGEIEITIASKLYKTMIVVIEGSGNDLSYIVFVNGQRMEHRYVASEAQSRRAIYLLRTGNNHYDLLQ